MSNDLIKSTLFPFQNQFGIKRTCSHGFPPNHDKNFKFHNVQLSNISTCTYERLGQTKNNKWPKQLPITSRFASPLHSSSSDVAMIELIPLNVSLLISSTLIIATNYVIFMWH